MPNPEKLSRSTARFEIMLSCGILWTSERTVEIRAPVMNPKPSFMVEKGPAEEYSPCIRLLRVGI